MLRSPVRLPGSREMSQNVGPEQSDKKSLIAGREALIPERRCLLELRHTRCGTSGMVLGRLASVISGQVDGASDQLLVRAASMSPTGHLCEILSMRGLRDMGSSSGTLTRCGFPVEGSTIGTAAVPLGHDTAVSDRSGPHAPMATRLRATRRLCRRAGRRGLPSRRAPMTGQ
jgi:hypothetical protein